MKKLLIILVSCLMSMSVLAAEIYWTGDAPAVAQVDTITVGGTVEADDIFILTMTGWDGSSYALSTVAGSTTLADVATTIAAAWNASTNALLTPITASTSTADVILTADTAGDAHSCAATTTETGGGAADDQTFVLVATTASSGPKHWDKTANWSTGALPGAGAGDNVYIENADDTICYGLGQSGQTVLTSLNIAKTFTGTIGYNGISGSAGTYLDLKATTVNIGYNYTGVTATGSGRIMLDIGAADAATINVFDTAATATDAGKPCVRLLADDVATDADVIVYQGKVGIAYETGETATLDDLTIGYNASASGDVSVVVGSGTTLIDIAKRIGTLTLRAACTTLTNESGAAYTYGTGAITTVTINSGTVYASSTGTIGTANAIAGTLDLTQSLAARTITTMKIGNGGSLKYDPSIITLTNKIAPYESSGKFMITSQEF